MTRTAFQFKSPVAVLLITAGIAAVSPAQQTGDTPPKELLQYVHHAVRSGVEEDKIKQQAMAVGWSASVVDQAIVYEKSGEGSQPSSEATVTATPAKPQPATGEVQAATPTGPVNGLSEGTIAIGSPRNLEAPEEYQIAVGDTLQISVWREPEISVPSEIVRPDGKITVPLIKEVDVAGLTPKQVEKTITEQLAKFITDANVTVVVTAMGVKKVYVTGGVKKEGPIPFVYGLTVMQAISEAGGLNDYAKRKMIYILRTEKGREYRLDFNYNEVVKGVRMEQNILLEPSDTVVVPSR